MAKLKLRRGPLLMTLAAMAFTAMLSFMKLARTEIDSLDVLFWRGVTAMPLAFLLCVNVGFRAYRPGLILLRASLGSLVVFLVAYAAKGLAVADMALLFRMQPIVVAILAPLALGQGERAGRAIWLVLFVSMIGVILILAPSVAVGSQYGLAALAAGVASACAHVTLRALMRTDDPRIVVFYFQLLTIPVAVIALYLQSGRLPAIPPTGVLAPVLGVGVMGMLGQILMTYAYRADRAAVVAAASYSAVLFAALVDIVFFLDIPGLNVWIGGAIIVAAGIWLVLARDGSGPGEASGGSEESTESP